MLDCVSFFISVCVNGKNKTDEVSRGHLAAASTPSIAARMESQLEQQQIMKVGQRKVNKSQRKAETDRVRKLAVCIIWGPVGYHSVWRHKAELALLWICSQTALAGGLLLHGSSGFMVNYHCRASY